MAQLMRMLGGGEDDEEEREEGDEEVEAIRVSGVHEPDAAVNCLYGYMLGDEEVEAIWVGSGHGVVA